jgi:1-acyl-sn-glycerol-3-phosphate acyltransferase
MVLSLTNSVRIKRESLRSGAQFLTQAEEEMKKGSSILLFPEGTRSRTTEMRSFKEGAFLLAKRSGSGIIPIVHIGSEKTFDRGSWVLKGKANIHIRVLDEIPPDEVEKTEVKDLMIRVREIMEQELNRLEQEKEKE